MKTEYNIPALQRIVSNLSQLTGICVSFFDYEFKKQALAYTPDDYCSTLQAIGQNRNKCNTCIKDLLVRCKASGKLELHICHAGLYEAAMPIIKENVIVGYVVFGRMHTTASPADSKSIFDKDGIYNLNQLYHQLPFYTEQQMVCLYDLLSDGLFENAITFKPGTFIEAASQYIDEHLGADLTINLLCHTLTVSKNFLYNSFHDSYGKTVNEYISERRVERAKELLVHSTDSIYDIANSVGFDNISYFYTLFKKKVGISPTEYRKKYSP